MSKNLSENIIKQLNKEVSNLNSEQIIRWAYDKFKPNLFALSSFGADSAAMFNLLEKAGINIPVLTIDTGFWFEETHLFKNEMIKRYSLEVSTYSPAKEDIEEIKKDRLWEKDIDEYHEITRIIPLNRAIKELDIKALISGVRGGQTENRSKLNTVGIGKANELRIHPILEWSEEDVSNLFEKENLPRHLLYSQGYDSVGDYTTTTPGAGRHGRSAMGTCLECGIHLQK